MHSQWTPGWDGGTAGDGAPGGGPTGASVPGPAGPPVVTTPPWSTTSARDVPVEDAPVEDAPAVTDGVDDGAPVGEEEVHRSAVDAVDGLLDEVELALARLDDGTYGRCETCGSPIDDTRLAASPLERTCGGCAQAAPVADGVPAGAVAGPAAGPVGLTATGPHDG